MAQDVIFGNKVDALMILARFKIVNPAANRCEANGALNISTQYPLGSYYFGRGARKGGFEWTYNFCFSLQEQAPLSIHEWGKIPANKVVGVFWPKGDDGYAFARTYPAFLKGKVYRLVDPGRLDKRSNFAAQIATFKAAKVELVGAVLPS